MDSICQDIASPSLSASVASQRVSPFEIDPLIAVTAFIFFLFSLNFIKKSSSGITSPSSLGRSFM